MDRREFSRAFWAASWAGLPAAALLHAGPAQALVLSEGDAAAGVRAALEKGAAAALASLGRPDGFLGNPRVRIPLPGVLEDAAKLLRAAGQQKRVDELVTAMNRAAEAAVPEGKAVLLGAVRSITVTDALAIVRGGQTAVTDFFAQRTRAPLTDKFLPIVTRATERVKLAERYNAFVSRAARIGLLKGPGENLQQYVTAKSLDGLFTVIAEEERKLRENPLKAGSAILRKVFGG